ncbi:MAG: alpha/beta fold hydrolase, partial [Balneolaceae bacterium]|nr:alpha/beta fold hydrolase [Balneolaceae bacterium]
GDPVFLEFGAVWQRYTAPMMHTRVAGTPTGEMETVLATIRRIHETLLKSLRPSYLKPLSDQYELIFYDQRLSGRSTADLDSTEIGLDILVDDIEGIRNKFDLDKIHLTGHSWGALLAMKYALKYPSNLRSLVLLNAMPASSELWNREEEIIAERITREDRLRRQAIVTSDLFQDNRPKAVEELLLLYFRNQFQDETLTDSLDFEIPDDYSERGRRFGYIMNDIENYNLHPELSAMKVPTLLVYGSIEPATSISGPKLQQTLPNSEMIVIEDAGHFPFVEKPDLFLARLREFLEAH